MIDTDPEASQYIDEWLMNHYSDLALLCELGKSLFEFTVWSASRPWSHEKAQ